MATRSEAMRGNKNAAGPRSRKGLNKFGSKLLAGSATVKSVPKFAAVTNRVRTANAVNKVTIKG